MWQAWVNLIAGVWAIISGASPELTVPVNFWITGAVMAVFGFWTPRRKWQGIVDGFLGLWLIISGFVPSLTTQSNLFIVGIAVAVLAAWRAFETGQRHAATAGVRH